MVCICCGNNIVVSSRTRNISRVVFLQTIHQSSVEIHATDVQCNVCNQLNAHDELYDALFALDNN